MVHMIESHLPFANDFLFMFIPHMKFLIKPLALTIVLFEMFVQKQMYQIEAKIT
jgi:hypothetical protein